MGQAEPCGQKRRITAACWRVGARARCRLWGLVRLRPITRYLIPHRRLPGAADSLMGHQAVLKVCYGKNPLTR